MTHTATYSKSKLIAVLLAVFIGGLGIHRFYLDDLSVGFIYLISQLIAVLLAMVIFIPLPALISGIAILDGIYIVTRPRSYFIREVEVSD